MGAWGLVLAVVWAQPAPYDPTFAVEVHRGLVIGPAKVVGMGGAYVSIAEGAGAMGLNPAAAAARALYNSDQYFDWDWSLDGNTSLGALDLENNRLGQASGHDAGVALAALSFQLGAFGLGATISGITLRLDELDVVHSELAISTGLNLLQGQLVLGGQLLLATTNIEIDQQPAFSQLGLGVAVGGLARPTGEPFSFGFYFRPRMELGSLDDVPAGAPFGRVQAPPQFRVPAQLVVGMSYALGDRALNRVATLGSLPDGVEPEPLSVERERYVISADVVYIEPSEQATGLEAWARGQLQPVQAVRPSIGFRVGIDSEPLQDRLQWRLGFYWEPTRFYRVSGRTHLTSGFDLRLFEWVWMWRAGMAVDLSREYSNLIFSFGFWR
jgi:hypothetical protein